MKLLGRITLALYLMGLLGVGVGIAFRKSDAAWFVWLIYVATGALCFAALLTVFSISTIGDRPKR